MFLIPKSISHFGFNHRKKKIVFL